MDAFFDGFTGAGIFGQVHRPGAPDELIDSRPLDEFLQSDEFLQVQAAFDKAPDGLVETPEATTGNQADLDERAKTQADVEAKPEEHTEAKAKVGLGFYVVGSDSKIERSLRKQEEFYKLLGEVKRESEIRPHDRIHPQRGPHRNKSN